MNNPHRSNFKLVIDKVPVMNFLSYRDYLKQLFGSLKDLNKDITHKDFSELLGFARTNNTIRLVIGGNRILSRSAASNLCKALQLKGIDRRYFILLVEFNNERVPKVREEYFSKLLKLKKESDPNKDLNQNQMKYFSEWYHPIIREILSVGAGLTAEEIQSLLRFPLRLDEIKKSLSLLEGMGYIRKDINSDKYFKSGQVIETDAVVDSLAVTQYHQQMIEMAKDSITRIHESVRTVNAVTVSVPVAAVPLINDQINKLLDGVLALEAETEKHSDVFQLNVQLFPFTKADKE